MEAIALLDRLKRQQIPAPLIATSALPKATHQAGKSPSPRAVRALELCLKDSYRMALPELMGLLNAHGFSTPPHLLPTVLELALAAQQAEHHVFSEQLLQLSGERGKWLAKQHPDWKRLLPNNNWQATFMATPQPAKKAALLRRWRKTEPEAAREALSDIWPNLSPKQQEQLIAALRVGLHPEDHSFLRAACLPRRKGVRNISAKLLLLPGCLDTELYAELKALASDWLELEKLPNIQFSVNKIDLPILDIYGFNDHKKHPFLSLLSNLPPRIWQEVTGLKPSLFLLKLGINGKATLEALLRAIIFYEDAEWRLAFLQFLIRQDRPQSDYSKLTQQLYDQITLQEYQQLCQWASKNVEQVFRIGSVLRYISTQNDFPWPTAFCKQLVQEFTEQFAYGRRTYGFGLSGAAEWKTLPYRMDTALFPWLRQQLYAATERDDQYGNIATKMLQVLSFRKTMKELADFKPDHK